MYQRLGYRERNELLAELGYPTYKDYLASEVWKRTRRRVLVRDQKVCAVCGKRRSTQVHHDIYTRKNLLGEDLIGLYSVCRRCHKKFELKGGKKRALTSAQQSFRARVKKRTRKGRKKKRKGSGMCGCGLNRLWHGGPCPPCRQKHDLDPPPGVSWPMNPL